MKGNWVPYLGGVLTAAAVLTVGAAGAAAQTANVAGAWTMEVTTDAGGTTTPSLTLVQDGDRLTGHYSSPTLGEADVTGTVDGSQVTISFLGNLQGQEVPVTYAGTADGNSMSGTIDIAGGIATGTFTARRQGE